MADPLPSFRIGKLLAGSLLAFSFTTAAGAAITPPADGSRYTYRCEFASGLSFSQQYTVKGQSGDAVKVEVSDNRGSHSYEKPFYLAGTTMVKKAVKGSQRSLMRGDLDDFEGLAQLNVGWRETGWIDEVRPGTIGTLNWHYTVSVPGKEFVYNAVVGDVEVFIIEEERWVGTYSSTLYTHYYPRIQFPTYWQFKDSNLVDMECTLTAFDGGGAQKRPQRTQPLVQATPRAPEYKPATTQVAAVQTQPVVVRQQPVQQAPQPQIQQPVSRQQTAVQTPQPTARTEPAGKQQILARLHQKGLITDQEYQQKLAAIGKPSTENEIGPALAALNKQFRSREISAEKFIQERTRLIARINGRTMAPETALRVAKSLADEKLISQIEYTRKRQEILEDL